jgi:putative spermidine/putrescine transport system permease protein
MLPLWSSYLVKVYAWKLILAKEGIVTWALAKLHLLWLLDAWLALPVVGGTLAIDQLSPAPSSSSSMSGCPS